MARKPSLYATPEWRAARKSHLLKHPMCQVCGAKPRRRHVHHLDGIKNDPQHKKLMTLCPSCHDVIETVFRRRGNLKWPMYRTLWSLAQRKLAA